MIWKVNEPENAGPAPEASATTHAPPPSTFVGSSHTPALAAPPVLHHLAAPPSTLLAAPDHSPAATVSASPELLLAQLLEHMVDEAGLEEEAEAALEELGEEDLMEDLKMMMEAAPISRSPAAQCTR